MFNRFNFSIILLIILAIAGCGTKKEQIKLSKKPVLELQEEESINQPNGDNETKELDDLLEDEFNMPDYENELIG